jgi:Fur family peroxide stress response transcriptional regulator
MKRLVSNSDRLDELKEACRRHGIPLTVQRSVILEALAGRDDHPTADQILEDVRTRLPGLSRTTVYRVLETLTRIGLAVKTCTPGTAVRFDSCVERHHHLVCLECDRVVDLHDPALDALPLPGSQRGSGFSIQDYSIHFRGLCAECRQQRAGSPKVARSRRETRTQRHGSKGDRS